MPPVPKIKNYAVDKDIAAAPVLPDWLKATAPDASPELLAQAGASDPKQVQPHATVDPVLLRGVLDRLAATGVAKQAFSTYTPTSFGVKQGRGVSTLPSSGWDAAEHEAQAPLTQETARVGNINAARDTLSKWRDSQAAAGAANRASGLALAQGETAAKTHGEDLAQQRAQAQEHNALLERVMQGNTGAKVKAAEIGAGAGVKKAQIGAGARTDAADTGADARVKSAQIAADTRMNTPAKGGAAKVDPAVLDGALNDLKTAKTLLATGQFSGDTGTGAAEKLADLTGKIGFQTPSSWKEKIEPLISGPNLDAAIRAASGRAVTQGQLDLFKKTALPMSSHPTATQVAKVQKLIDVLSAIQASRGGPAPAAAPHAVFRNGAWETE